MVAYETDEEQVEALKKWWDENGKSLLLTVGAALLVSFGYQAWQKNIQESGELASGLYEDLRVAVNAGSGEPLPENQRTTAKYLADTLLSEHEGSVYARFAALQMAKVLVDAGTPDRAAEKLRWVMETAEDQSINAVARLRLARVLSASDQIEEALALLDDDQAAGFAAAFSETRGDIYLQSGRQAEARTAYLAAQSMLEDSASNPLLQMKLDDMATASGLDVIEEVEEVETPAEVPEE